LIEKLNALLSHRLHDLGVQKYQWSHRSYDSDDIEEKEGNNDDGEDGVLDINESISLDYKKATDPKVLQIVIKLWYGCAQAMMESSV